MEIVKLTTTDNTYLFQNLSSETDQVQGILAGNFLRLSIPAGTSFTFQKGLKLVKQENVLTQVPASEKESEFFQLLAKEEAISYAKKIVAEYGLEGYIKAEVSAE